MTLTLADEIDVARGDVLVAPDATGPKSPTSSRRTCMWMAEEAMLPGRSYLMRIGTKFVPATRHRASSTRSTSTRSSSSPAKHAALNEIGFCNLSTGVPVAFDPYARTARPAPSS